jgi:hypothetical protein
MLRLDRLAVALPVILFLIMWLLVLAAPSIHNVCTTRGVNCRHFRRPQLRASVLGLWDVLVTSGILNDPGVIMDWGTLLGAVRENDLIEHDYDIDVRAPAGRLCSMYWQLQPLVARSPYLKLRATLIILATGAYPSIWIGDTRYGTGVDIEPYIIEYGRVHRASYCCMLRRTECYLIPMKHRSRPADEIFPLRQTTIRGVTVNIPRDAEKMLQLYYGPNWRTPLIKKKVVGELEHTDYTEA